MDNSIEDSEKNLGPTTAGTSSTGDDYQTKCIDVNDIKQEMELNIIDGDENYPVHIDSAAANDIQHEMELNIVDIKVEKELLIIDDDPENQGAALETPAVNTVDIDYSAENTINVENDEAAAVKTDLIHGRKAIQKVRHLSLSHVNRDEIVDQPTNVAPHNNFHSYEISWKTLNKDIYHLIRACKSIENVKCFYDFIYPDVERRLAPRAVCRLCDTNLLGATTTDTDLRHHLITFHQRKCINVLRSDVLTPKNVENFYEISNRNLKECRFCHKYFVNNYNDNKNHLLLAHKNGEVRDRTARLSKRIHRYFDFNATMTATCKICQTIVIGNNLLLHLIEAHTQSSSVTNDTLIVDVVGHMASIPSNSLNGKHCFC